MAITRSQARKLQQQQQQQNQQMLQCPKQITANDLKFVIPDSTTIVQVLEKETVHYNFVTPYETRKDVIRVMLILLDQVKNVKFKQDRIAWIDQLFRVIAINFELLTKKCDKSNPKNLLKAVLDKLFELHGDGWENAIVYQKLFFPDYPLL